MTAQPFERFPRSRLRTLSKEPIRNGVGESAQGFNKNWPRYIRITDIAGPRSLKSRTLASLPPALGDLAPVNHNDLLLAAVGATYGKSYLHRLDGSYCYAGFLVKVSPNTERVSPSYISYWTESEDFWDQVQSQVIQATIQNFSAFRYRNLTVPLPPLDEQRAIARFLDRKSRRIARFIHARQRMIALLNEQKQAIIHQAVTRSLDPEVPLKPSGIDWLGDIPAHWNVRKVRAIAKVRNGATPSRANPRFWIEGSEPWVASGKVKEWIIETPSTFITKEAALAASLKRIPSGSVLVGLVGQGKTRGTAALLGFDSFINQNVAAVTPGPAIIGHWLLYVFADSYATIRELGRGGNQEALNCELLARFAVPVPPKQEQIALVDALEQQVASITSTRKRLLQEIELLREYRTRLIADVVTGKLDIRDHLDAAEGAPDDLDELSDIDPTLGTDDGTDDLDDDLPREDSPADAD